MKIFSLILGLLITANGFAVTQPLVLKWDASIATPGQKGLITLTPGMVVTLDAGTTRDVFWYLGDPIPDAESSHRAVSLEFRYRFLLGNNVIAQGVLHTDQHGAFTPAEPKLKPWFQEKPANQELSSTETFTVPAGAESLEIERVAVDRQNAKLKSIGKSQYPLVGNRKALIVLSGDSRGDEKFMPQPFVWGAPVTAGKPFTLVFDEYRAQNAWVRTAPKFQGHGFNASMAGADVRTKTCLNKKLDQIYYESWSEMPLFEITTRVRFDQDEWQELPVKKLYPAWASGNTQDRFPIPFDTIAGVFRETGPYHPKNTPSIFPQPSPRPNPLHKEELTVPAGGKTISVQTKMHAYLVAYYGPKFEGTGYVGEDCIRLYVDGQRTELEDLWDTPDFTQDTAWEFAVN